MEAQHCRKRQRRSSLKKKYEIKKDFATSLFSKELVLHVFSFLSFKDLIQCAAVSTDWRRMASDEMVKRKGPTILIFLSFFLLRVSYLPCSLL